MNNAGSTLIEGDFIYDSSKVRRYRSICNGCGKDRGYVRKVMRHKMCMSCGQKGKCSPRKGASLTDATKLKISHSNLQRNLTNNPNYVKPSQIQKRLIHSLRTRIGQFISNKSKPTAKLLGCSQEEFLRYLESKFKPGMTWSNYGRKGWHLDHIIPLSAFDLTDSHQLEQACHYSNIQPLWWIDNLRKSNK